MIIKEFRIVLPLTVDEFQCGQLYAVGLMSKAETGGGEGVEVVRNERFTSHLGLPARHNRPGQFTHKIYHLRSKMPAIIRTLAPEGALVIHEESWNAFPYCKTVLTNPDCMKENFKITIESVHLADNGYTDNALNLSSDQLKMRDVMTLDITSDALLKNGDYNLDTDPKKFRSRRTGRGTLTEGWQQKQQPLMCTYKVVTVFFKMFPVSGLIESLAMNQYPRLLLKFHRETWCWVDNWIDLTMNDIRRSEQEVAQQLAEQRPQGAIRGMVDYDEEVIS